MCLSTAYKTSDPGCVIMEYVSAIQIDGDKVILTDVMGDQTTVEGKLAMVDLTGGVVRIDCD